MAKRTEADLRHAELLCNMEALMDKHGLRACLEIMADLCSAKGEHIGRNWGYKDNRNQIEAWGTARDAITKALGEVYVP